MDEKTLQSITALATKLGTTAEYLWAVLLKQAPIYGITTIMMYAAWFSMVLVWVRFVRSKTKTPPADPLGNFYPHAAWCEEAGALAWMSAFASALLVAIGFGSDLPMITAAFFNPEYWALMKILK